MSEYPDIQRGTQFGQVPARQWQNVFGDLRRVVGMTAGPGLILDKGFTNYRITRTQPTVLLTPGGGPAAVAQFRLTQSADAFPDHLVCRTWDGETQGSENVLIAKPWLLRRTPFDGESYGGVAYTYSSPTSRIASIGEDTEDQIIIPRYTIGDILKAVSGIQGGTGVSWEDVALEWEAHYASRAWAAVSLK